MCVCVCVCVCVNPTYILYHFEIFLRTLNIGRPVVDLWWSCARPVVVLCETCGGLVRDLWWSCARPVVVLFETCGGLVAV